MFILLLVLSLVKVNVAFELAVRLWEKTSACLRLKEEMRLASFYLSIG